MTATARDVIADVIGDNQFADAVLSALLAASESVRLELARRLCPEIVKLCNDRRLSHEVIGIRVRRDFAAPPASEDET